MIADGEWKADTRHGWGTMTFVHGLTYEVRANQTTQELMYRADDRMHAVAVVWRCTYHMPISPEMTFLSLHPALPGSDLVNGLFREPYELVEFSA